MSRISAAIIFQTRTPGPTRTTGPEDRVLSAVPARTRATSATDSAAGLREQTALAAGEACTPADSVVSTALAVVDAVSPDKEFDKSTTRDQPLGECICRIYC